MTLTVGQLIRQLATFKSELPVVVHDGERHLLIEETVNEWFPDGDRVVLYAGGDAEVAERDSRTSRPPSTLRRSRASATDAMVARKLSERGDKRGT